MIEERHVEKATSLLKDMKIDGVTDKTVRNALTSVKDGQPSKLAEYFPSAGMKPLTIMKIHKTLKSVLENE
ncbi:hypothetical protein ACFLQ2_05165 [archaeon]